VKRVYLDTSVFFKIFFDENGKETIDRIILLAQDKKIQIIISEWVINEAIATVEKKVLKGKISNDDAHDILFAIAEFLEQSYSSGIVVSYVINEKVVTPSRNIIESLHVNASDALHLHVAIISDSNYFISNDKELNATIKGSRLSVIPIDLSIKDDVERFFNDI
jgi:predicted nucleic acid-binding protein